MTGPVSGRVRRVIALLGLALGAAGSLGLMFNAGGRNQPVLLVLFAGWVFAPFGALALADWRYTQWSDAPRTTLHAAMLIMTFGSVALYSGVIPMPAGSRPAASYLMVPLGSWLLIALVVLATRRLPNNASGSLPPPQA